MSRLASINRDQRLYVLHCGTGYTCLGFDVCEERKGKLATELGVKLAGHRIGTRAAYTEYRRLVEIAGQRNRSTGWRSESELTPQLKGLEGHKIEVVTSWGERHRFIVGKSTGFIPCHLALCRRDSSGGPAVVGAPFKSVRRLERVR